MFEELYESMQRGELLLIEGGFCHWHLRRDGQITIREILSTKPGSGRKMLEFLKSKKPISIFAKCPSDLESNGWYKHMGFDIVGAEVTKTGRTLKLWRLTLNAKSEDQS